MENTPNNTGEDAVTITEALKRLGNQAPARQSVYEAVNKGKIREVSNKEDNPDGKRIVSWASVREYIDGGGFKPRQKSRSTDEGQSETTPLLDKQGVQVSPPESRGEVSSPAEPSGTVVPTEPRALKAGGKPGMPAQVTPPCIKATGKSSRKNNPAKSRERSNQKSPKKSVAPDKPKDRRPPPLRTIKNNLRHLDYEQTKAIRDWADNRLLTVLRPASSVVGYDSGNKTPQPA